MECNGYGFVQKLRIWQKLSCGVISKCEGTGTAPVSCTAPIFLELHFSISSVGRLFHPHSPLLFHSNQASAKSAYGQKGVPGKFHWLLRAIPKKRAKSGSHIS